jgi:hypothetical protein
MSDSNLRARLHLRPNLPTDQISGCHRSAAILICQVHRSCIAQPDICEIQAGVEPIRAFPTPTSRLVILARPHLRNCNSVKAISGDCRRVSYPSLTGRDTATRGNGESPGLDPIREPPKIQCCETSGSGGPFDSFTLNIVAPRRVSRESPCYTGGHEKAALSRKMRAHFFQEAHIPGDYLTISIFGLLAIVVLWFVFAIVRRLIGVLLLGAVAIGAWMIWNDPQMLMSIRDFAADSVGWG